MTMAKSREEILKLLNAPEALENLKALLASEPAPEAGRDVNNHIHTTYSFSPYSPTAAVWFARAAGLCTCGLMDHDSIAGAPEFLAAAEAAKHERHHRHGMPRELAGIRRLATAS